MSAQENAQAQEPRRGPMGHGPGGRMMPGEKPKNLKGTLAKLIAFMGRFKAAIEAFSRMGRVSAKPSRARSDGK